jgi:hypothetical protein
LAAHNSLAQIEPAFDNNAEIISVPPREPASRHGEKVVEGDVEVDGQEAEPFRACHGAD